MTYWQTKHQAFDKAELLYRISKSFASVRDGRELLAAIIREVQPIFGFYDIGLSVLDKSGAFYLDWASYYADLNPSEANTEIARQRNLGYPASEPLMVYAVERCVAAGKPIIINLNQEFRERFSGFPHLEIEIKHGFKQFLVTTLEFGGVRLGVLNFNATRAGQFDDADLELFQAIADLIATAVANIQAKEEILERERKQAVLYRIANHTAQVKDKYELLRLIVEDLQPIYRFYDIGLPVLDEARNCYVDWSATLPGISPSETNRHLFTEQAFYLPMDDPMYVYVMERLHQANEPIIVDFEVFDQLGITNQTLEIEAQHGYREAMAALLKVRGKVIGWLNFNSLSKGHFQQFDKQMFQAIADQVAIAVANILANEEILEREREKTQLLSISEAIARINGRHDLLQVIVERIRPVFGFDDNALFVIDPDGQHYRMWFANLPVEYEQGQASIEGTGIPMANNPVAEDVFRRPAHLISLEEMLAVAADNASIGQWLKESGTQATMSAPLRVGGKVIGCFNSHSRTAGRFSSDKLGLYQTVVDQIAVAVANILANEEILEREKEKSQLLSLVESLNLVRTRKELFETVHSKLKQFIHFDHIVITIYNKERTTTRHIFYPTTPEELAYKNYGDIGTTEQPLAGTAYEQFLNDPNIHLLTTDDLVKQFPDVKGVRILKDFKVQETLSVPILNGGIKIGTFEFHTKEKGRFNLSQVSLYTSLTEQVAIVLSNILANEEILEREREKSTLLSITEAITTIRDRDELFHFIADQVQPLFGFNQYTNIAVLNHDQTGLFMFFTKMTEEDQQDSEIPTFVQLFPFEGIFKTIAETTEVVITEENWKTSPKTAPIDEASQQIWRDLDFKYALSIALRSFGRVIGTFHVHFFEAKQFTAAQLRLFKSIADQIAVAVANILANEEILERARDKSRMLEITKAIAQVQDVDTLFRAIYEQLQPLFAFDGVVVKVLAPDGKTFRHLHTTLPVHFQTAEVIDYLTNSPVAGSPNELTLGSGNPRTIILDAEELAVRYRDKLPSQIGNGIVKELNFKEWLFTPLLNSGKLIGSLEMFATQRGRFHEAQFALFENAAGQIAAAIANILAKEEIATQLAEINQLKGRLEEENVYLKEEIRRNYNFEEIIGTAPVLLNVFEVVEQVAPTDATVLIQGETGTGKELIARALHNRSPRRERPLIKVNCAALPKELVESELFGHERGSFTGAHERRIGKFELADQSTIFLDEVGELSLDLQVKLLNVLQEKEIERLGGKGAIRLDFRVVAATNRNLRSEVQAGRFRADLYYRLSTVEMFMPPLRDRKEDIEALTSYFAQKYAAKFSRDIQTISAQMLAELNAYDFPGNVRELEHLVEQAVIFSRGDKLRLPRSLQSNPVNDVVAIANGAVKPNQPGQPEQTLEAIEREHILSVLRQTGGRIKGKNGAAEILGMKPSTVYYRMKKLGVQLTDPEGQ